MKNNYLLIDYGNSYIKAGIYDAYQDAIIEIVQVPNKKSARDLFKQFRYLGDRRPDQIIISATAASSIVEPFYNEAKKLLNAQVHVVGKFEFKDYIDLSNIEKDVFIGSDIYSCVLKLIKTFGNETSMIVCLGTAYFAIVVKNKQITAAYLLPSLTKGMEAIEKLTDIPRDYIPNTYDQNKGNNTITSFAAGANLCIEGFVENVAKLNKIKPENIVITGGDCFRYKNIRDKYKEVKNYVLQGLAELVKEKYMK